ncbi:MAG: J domain-containing protein [Planctomycetes bacterium]|nr:J domain-containing protein [Planctomycetota bacterium]
MTDSDPDWSLLPDDAREFFGLPPEFDATALKRAYMSLVRRFKPERFPAEFQKIRAAYEQLEAELRYGRTSSAPAPRVEVEPLRVAKESPAELLERLGPQGALAHLRAAHTRTPREWCALALLEEELGGDPERAPLVLVEGLHATRGASEVANLLAGLLRDAVRSPQGEDLLLRLAQLADRSEEGAGYPPQLYWMLTHRAWEDLVANSEPARLVSLLERASKTIGPMARSGELLFKLRLRRKWALSAPDELLAKLDAELLDELRHLPPWAAEEYDLVAWLTRYRAARETFAQGHALRAKLDAALEAIVRGDEERGDRALFEVLLECREQAPAVLDAFRHGGPKAEADAVALSILAWSCGEWRARRGLETNTRESSLEELAELFRLLSRRAGRSVHGRLRGCAIGCVWAVFALTFSVVITAVKDTISTLGWWLAVGLGGVTGVLVPKLLRRQYLKPSFALKDPILAEIHTRVWRPEIAAFLARTRAPLEQLRAVAEANQLERPYIPAWTFSDDPGLELVALSARFDG